MKLNEFFVHFTVELSTPSDQNGILQNAALQRFGTTIVLFIRTLAHRNEKPKFGVEVADDGAGPRRESNRYTR